MSITNGTTTKMKGAKNWTSPTSVGKAFLTTYQTVSTVATARNSANKSMITISSIRPGVIAVLCSKRARTVPDHRADYLIQIKDTRQQRRCCWSPEKPCDDADLSTLQYSPKLICIRRT